MRVLVVFFLFFLSNVLAAQTVFDSLVIETVEIQGKRNVKNGTQQIDSMALHGSQYSNLGESLQESANLFVKSYGIGSMASVSIRGTNSTQSNLLWNGIALNSSFNGVVDLSLFPTFFIDNAEVLYGLNSLQYGSGGLGGAVVMNNTPNFSETKQIQFQQKVGSFGMFNSNLRIDLGNEKFKSVSRIFYKNAENGFEYINYSKEKRPKETVKNANLEQIGILQSFYYRIGENQLLSADLWLYNSDRNLPPLMTSRELEEKQKDASMRMMLRYTDYVKKGKVNVVTAILQDEIDYYNEKSNSRSNTKTLDWRNYIQWEQQWGEKLKANFKVDANYSKLLSENKTERVIDRKTISAMAQLNYAFHQQWNIKGNISEELLIDEADFLLGFLELDFQPLSAYNSLWLYAKAGKNVKYPNLNDLYWEPGGNANLLAEQSQTIEAGLRHEKKWFNNRFQSNLETSLYRSNIDNYIQWQPTVYGYWEAKNLKEVALQGIESRLTLSDNNARFQKKITANYTYTQSINTKANHQYDASIHQQLIYIPEHQFNASAFLAWKDFYLQYGFQLMGARYITSDNTEYLPYYRISDFTLGKKLFYKKQQFRFSFSILNAFDVDYQAILHRPMPGRNYQFTLNYFLEP